MIKQLVQTKLLPDFLENLFRYQGHENFDFIEKHKILLLYIGLYGIYTGLLLILILMNKEDIKKFLDWIFKK